MTSALPFWDRLLALAGKDPKNLHVAVVQNAPVGLERSLRMKSQEELLQFLAKLTDAMSTRVTPWERFSFSVRNCFGFL